MLRHANILHGLFDERRPVGLRDEIYRAVGRQVRVRVTFRVDVQRQCRMLGHIHVMYGLFYGGRGVVMRIEAPESEV